MDLLDIVLQKEVVENVGECGELDDGEEDQDPFIQNNQLAVKLSIEIIRELYEVLKNAIEHIEHEDPHIRVVEVDLGNVRDRDVVGERVQVLYALDKRQPMH